MAPWSDEQLASADAVGREVVQKIWDDQFWPPTHPPPNFCEEYAAICQDGGFERRLVSDPS